MLCTRCKVKTVRISFPDNMLASITGRSLPKIVHRCPCCGLQWESELKNHCESVEKKAVVATEHPEFEEILLFERTIDGFK